jgi:type IV pilus assembly protein PilQ
MVEIWGNNLPLPQVSNVGNRTMIVLPGVSGERVRHFENTGAIPMLTSVRSEQVGHDFVITMMTHNPLHPFAVRGVPPSEAYTLHLKATEELRRIVEERVATAQPQTIRVPTGPFASNAPITMDLREAQLSDVFRMFGQQVNKNIIIHRSLPQVEVTMTFRNSPLSNVFGYLMREYNLAYEFIDQDTVVVGTAAGLGRISGRLETRAYRIAYADPEAIERLLPTLIPRLRDVASNEPNPLVVDARLRTIYASSTPDVLEEVAIAIQRLDHPGRQVMIHARILEFSDGDELDVANTLNAVYDHWAVSYSRGRLTGMYVDDNRVGRPENIPNPVPPGMANYPRVTAPVDPITPMHGIWRYFSAAFTALEERTRTRTVANPSIITIDGMEATVELVQQYPFEEITTTPDGSLRSSWRTRDIGPTLVITPTVGRDEIITLELALSTQEVIEEPPTIGAPPVTSERSVTTNVRVRNGEPFVIGGLHRTERLNHRLRVPILGQLPLLGEMFTFRTRSSRTTQVVMIVVPYILYTPDMGLEFERIMVRQ